MLGIPKEKILPGLLVPKIGNTYSAASPLGLAAILDIAKPGNRILVTSFGSGAGSDSFSIIVRNGILKKRSKARLVKDFVENKKYIEYSQYIKFRRKLKGVEE